MTICLFYLSLILGMNCEQAIVSKTLYSHISHEESSYSYHSTSCSIRFYDDPNYQGKEINVSDPDGVSNLELSEESAQTFGRCCWKIYQ